MTTARTGLMLYTVRRACADDFEGTLRAVAAMGYTGVEVFDLHGHDVADVRGWLDELGLEVCGLHAPLVSVEDDLPGLAETARALGTNRLVVSWVSPPESASEVADVQHRLEAVTAAATANGVQLGFHNHDAEVRSFDGEPSLLERLLAETPDVFLELDLGWAWYGGVDPAELLARAAGRVPMVHVKDFRDRVERSFCPVGDGAVDYAEIVPAAIAAGVEWLLVEQDEVEGSELDAAARSLGSLEGFVGVAA